MNSEDNNGISRRKFIVGVSVVGVSAGVVGSACSSNSGQEKPKPSTKAKKPSPKEAAAALCLMLGPWTKSDRDLADEFLGRFLTPERLADFSKHEDAIASLPKNLPNTQSGKLDKIPLDSLSTSERDAVLYILTSIYGIDEVRFYVAGEEEPGHCMGNLSFIAAVPT